jgi:4-hydroxybenzoate polyprenyltransferase
LRIRSKVTEGTPPVALEAEPPAAPTEDGPVVGIRAGYPRLSGMVKLRAYIACARPFTLLAVFVGVAAAAGMNVAYGNVTWPAVLVDWRHLAYGVATLLMVQIGGNFVNQATDQEDEINRKYRPVVRGWVSREEASTIGHLLWFFAILRAATMGPAFGALVTALVATSYAYSSPPLRLKQRPWGGNISVALARGMLGFLAAWSLWGNPLDPHPWVAGAVLTLFLVGATTAKDFADEAGDRAHGVRNLVVQYGPRRAAWMSLPFILSPVVTIGLAAALGWLFVNTVAYLVATLVVLTFAYHLIYSHGTANKVLEGNRPWMWMYFSLLALQVVFAVEGFI